MGFLQGNSKDANLKCEFYKLITKTIMLILQDLFLKALKIIRQQENCLLLSMIPVRIQQVYH